MMDISMNRAFANNGNPYKLKGFVFSMTEVIFLAVIALAILFIAYNKWPDIRDLAYTAAERVEMNNMKEAAASYTNLNKNGKTPSSVQDLVNGVSSTDSVDGQDHTSLLSAKSAGWNDGAYQDKWGNAFVFGKDGSDPYIESWGANGTSDNGEGDDIRVYY